MEIKLFGKSLFEVIKNSGLLVYNSAVDRLSKSEFLLDFYKETGGSLQGNNPPYAYAISEITGTITKIQKSKPKKEITPKGVYELKMLNDASIKIKADPKYIDEQIELFKEKLGMIKSSEFDMNRGTVEIGSILSRFENRKKYPKFQAFFEEFPCTTTGKILNLVKEHPHLQLGEVAQFLADMPKEAVDVMKSYTSKTKELCDKKPVFYIIAKKKDFEKTEKRRDPILLVQSPFGHFWQILGAWDEEMLLVEEL